MPVVAAIVGAIYGFGADRLSVRWPAHEEGYRPRGIDWRTLVVTLTGAFAGYELGIRAAQPRDALVLLPFVAALVVLLATDLDQRLLPDVLTLPLIPFAAAVLLLGWSPALAGKDLGIVSGVIAAIVAPALLFVTDRLLGGDLGFGDLKLSVSLGLMLGLSALFYGLVVASLGFAVVLVVLLLSRRIGLKSAVPFGPVLIFGAFIGALLA